MDGNVTTALELEKQIQKTNIPQERIWLANRAIEIYDLLLHKSGCSGEDYLGREWLRKKDKEMMTVRSAERILLRTGKNPLLADFLEKYSITSRHVMEVRSYITEFPELEGRVLAEVNELLNKSRWLADFYPSESIIRELEESREYLSDRNKESGSY